MLITDDSASYSIHTVIVPSDFTLFSGIGILFAIAWYVLQIIARWKALIPFYNSYTQYELTWSVSMFWLVIALSLAGGILNSLIGGGLIMIAVGLVFVWLMVLVVGTAIPALIRGVVNLCSRLLHRGGERA